MPLCNIMSVKKNSRFIFVFLLALIFCPQIFLWGQEYVSAKDIASGTYRVQAESSSSMFRIEEAVVTGNGEKLLADLKLSGSGYSMLFTGTGADAASADTSDERISEALIDKDGKYHFTIEFSALNKEFDLAAFSKKKQKWYDRKVTLYSEGIEPENIFITPYPRQKDMLSDGLYSIDVKFKGGSGKASIKSPAKVWVRRGLAEATIKWSSPNYDYMKINNEIYLNKSQPGENSTFEIPLIKFDYPMPVYADTTAMGRPHEILYTLEFSLKSASKKSRYFLLTLVALVPLVLCIGVIICLGKKK